MRFLPIAQARVTVVGGMMHDARESRRAAEAIIAKRPRRIIVDRSIEEWSRMRSDDYQRWLCTRLPGLNPEALWKTTAQVARQTGAEIVLLHREAPPVPPRAMRDLQHLVDREGLDVRGDPKQDLMKVHSEYVARVPLLWKYIEGRRDASAARLRAALEVRPDDAVAVLPWPDGDAICDRVQAWA